MALTNAEKQQRWRDKRNAERLHNQDALARALKDNERLRKRVAELETKQQTKRSAAEPPPLPRTPADWAAAKVAAEHERREKRAAMRAARALVSPVSPQEEPLLREEVERLTRLVKSRNALIKELKQTLAYEASHRRPRMTRKLHKQIRSLLHPDRAPNDEQMRRRLEGAFQDFSAVEFEFHPDGVT